MDPQRLGYRLQLQDAVLDVHYLVIGVALYLPEAALFLVLRVCEGPHCPPADGVGQGEQVVGVGSLYSVGSLHSGPLLHVELHFPDVEFRGVELSRHE